MMHCGSMLHSSVFYQPGNCLQEMVLMASDVNLLTEDRP